LRGSKRKLLITILIIIMTINSIGFSGYAMEKTEETIVGESTETPVEESASRTFTVKSTLGEDIYELTPEGGETLKVSRGKKEKKIKVGIGESSFNEDTASVEFTNEYNETRFLSFSLLDNNKKIKKLSKPKKIDNKLVYEEVYDDTDVEFEISDKKLKETVIVKKDKGDYTYRYQLNYDDNILLNLKDNYIEVLDKETEEILGMIETPFAYDSSESPEETYNCFYALETMNETQSILTLELVDEIFINNAIFPVYIDPTIVANNLVIHGTFTNSSSQDASNYLTVTDDEYGSSKEQYPCFYISGDIPYSSSVSSAKLSVYIRGLIDKNAETADMAFTVHPITEFWTTNTEGKPYYGNSVATVNYEGKLNQWLEIDVTNIVNTWSNLSKVNYGFIFIPVEVSSNEQALAQFGDPNYSNPPFLEITYTNHKNYFDDVKSFYTWGARDQTGINYSDRMYIEDDEKGDDDEFNTAIIYDINGLEDAVIHSAAMTFVPSLSGTLKFYYAKANQKWDDNLVKPTATFGSYSTLGVSQNGKKVMLDVTQEVIDWISNPSLNYGIYFQPKEVSSGTYMRGYLYNSSTAYSGTNHNGVMGIVGGGSPKYKSPHLYIDYSYEPTLVSTSISNDENVSETFTPSINVIDKDNDLLTCELYIDDMMTPYESKSITASSTSKNLAFSAIDSSSLSEGTHNIKFKLIDPEGLTDELSYTIVTDTVMPTGALKLDSKTTNNIQYFIQNPSDNGSGLASEPYRFTFDGVQYDWQSSPIYFKSNLIPNKRYYISCQVKDNAGNTLGLSSSTYTNSEIPSIFIDDVYKNQVNISFIDNNPIETEYLVMCNDKYINSNGLLSDSVEWITLTNSKLDIYGLDSSTSYVLKAKTRANNTNKIESNYSSDYNFTTNDITGDELSQVIAEKSGSNITVSWPNVTGATSYDVQINGTTYSTIENRYSFTETVSPTYINVRAIISGVANSWSNQLTTDFTNGVRIVKTVFNDNQEIDIMIIGNSLSNGDVENYEISYDSTRVTLDDGSLFTKEKEIQTGSYLENNLQIINSGTGLFEATSNIQISEIGIYSSIVNIIRFSRLTNDDIIFTITIAE